MVASDLPQHPDSNKASSKIALRWFGVVLLILLAFGLRIYRLDAVDLRGDEAYSVVNWTVEPFSEKWLQLAREEPHPAGAMLIYWAWNGLMGTSVFATRLLSVLGSVLGTAVMIAIARRLLRNWRLAAMVGFLCAVNPFLIWHAQDARTYGVLSALTPLTFYLLLRAVDDDNSERRLRPWLFYILIQTLTLYIYYFEVFWVAAQGLYILSLQRMNLFKQAFKAWIIVGLLSIPVGIQVYYLLFVSEYEGTAGDADASALFKQFIPTLLFGENTTSIGLGILFALIFAVGLWWVGRSQLRQARSILSWALIPPTLLFIVSNFSSFFRPRYVMTVTPALLLGVVIGTYYLGEATLRHSKNQSSIWVAATVTILMSVVSVFEVNDYYFNDVPKSPNWQKLTDYLEDRTTENDVVIFGQPDPAIEYYYNGSGTITFIPIEEVDLEGAFETMLQTYDGIFLLNGERTGDAGSYFQNHAQHIIGDTQPNVVQYRSREVNPREIQHPLDVQFGDVARLCGYSLLQGDFGGTILLLYWEPLVQTATDFSVLLHLVTVVEGAGESPLPVAAALDHGVANSLVSTRTWSVGTIVRDPIAIPVELPAGHYFIRVGMYETSSSENRLLIADDDLEAQFSGRMVIGELNIRK